MAYLFGYGGFGSTQPSGYNPSNIYQGMSPWYGGAGASATDPSSIPGSGYGSSMYGYQQPQQQRSPYSGQQQQQQNPYNNIYPTVAAAPVAPLMSVPQTYVSPQQPYVAPQQAYVAPQQPLQPYAVPYQPVYQPPAPTGPTPQELMMQQLQQARDEQARQAAEEAERRRAWEQALAQEQLLRQQEAQRIQAIQAQQAEQAAAQQRAWEQALAQEQQARQTEAARLAAWQESERARIAQETAAAQEAERVRQAQVAAEREAFNARAAGAENEWYNKQVANQSDFDTKWAGYEQAMQNLPEPDWNNLPVFQILRGQMPAASFQQRAQVAEQALAPQVLPTMPGAPKAVDPYPVFLGRDVSPELMQKAAALRQGWADRSGKFAAGGPKPKPIKLTIPDAHKANYQQYSNLLKSERDLLNSGIRSQAQSPDDWVEALMRSAPRGRGFLSTGWG